MSVTRSSVFLSAGLAFAGLLTSTLAAAGDSGPSMSQLGQLSIEQLEDLEVTSVAKRPQPLAEAAASVFVITAEDIRRSGALDLAEALRLAPNLEVARINAFTYAISARGFNSPESSNKLLVLIDGRSIYSPLGGTIFWQGIDVPLADIERVEVISGPGGTLYGANAVNGVVNIITKSSADTQGLFVGLGGGTETDGLLIHYGDALPDFGTYRAYLRAFHRNDTDPVSALDTTHDSFNALQGGFRTDGTIGGDTLTLQGDGFYNRVRDSFEKLWGGNLLARWNHPLDDGSSLSVVAYWDLNDRDAPLLQDRLQTYDLQAQHTFSLGDAHQIVWGGEFRVWREALFSQSPFYFAKPWATLTLGNAFAQDDIALTDRLKLTAGVKAEYNSYSGFDILPNLRLAWQPAKDTLFWAAVSRAVRTPSRIDRELIAPGFLLPAPNFRSEKLTAFEAGYRGEIFPKLSLSISGYYNDYNDLRSDQYWLVGNALTVQLQNHLNATTYGAEIWGTYTPLEWWRLRAGFNSFQRSLSLDANTNDLAESQTAGQDPPYQAQLRSEMNLGTDWELDLDLRHVAHVKAPQLVSLFPQIYQTAVTVPSYTEADARIGWHFAPNFVLSVEGLNLLHNRHIEFNDPASYPPRYIKRSFFVNLRAAL
ncbi:MAG: TonB-dependent receptor [Alphaproteobacteria bacterium]|nr:TonB-dependent receptor [Alphaproteobacteria bacterium]